MGKKMQFFVLGVMMFAVITPLFVFAAIVPCGTSYNPTPCSLCDLFALGQTTINFLMWYGAPTIVVLVFAWGGFKILISGANPGYRQEGIRAIRNGIIGLLIVFSAWIVVNEFLLFFAGKATSGPEAQVTSLNPWTKITCYQAIQPSASTTAAPSAATTTDYVTSENTNLATITNNPNISVYGSAGSGPNGTCATQTESNGGKCTSVAYLPQKAIDGLNTLQSACGCSLTVTGGTEAGHKTHGPGLPVVDLRNDNPASSGSTPLGMYINNNKTSVSSNTAGTLYILPIGTFLYEIDTTTMVTHWHVVFN